MSFSRLRTRLGLPSPLSPGPYARIVVKLGSQVVMDGGPDTARPRLHGLMAEMADQWRQGRELILVSSGALSMGAHQAKVQPRGWAEKRACAALGQSALMAFYQDGFAGLGLCAAQVLVTSEDFGGAARRCALRTTLGTLLAWRALPILNENDVVSALDEEPDAPPRLFADNDHLAAMVAQDLEADLLILLSDVDAVYTWDPARDADAQPIRDVAAGEKPGAELQGQGSLGRGGMASKVEAACRAAMAGVPVKVANGLQPGILGRLLGGESAGTHFHHNTLARARP